MTTSGIDPARIADLKAREDARFAETHGGSIAMWERAKPVMPNGVPMSWLRSSYDHPPLFVDTGKGAHFLDVDGNDYADFNIADMSMFAGYAPEPVVEAVSRRVSGNGEPVPAADRGFDLGRRGARSPLRDAARGSSRCRRPTPTPR